MVAFVASHSLDDIFRTPGHSSHLTYQTINFDHSLSIGFIVDIAVAHFQTDIERKDLIQRFRVCHHHQVLPYVSV